MERRQFLKSIGLGTVAVAVAPEALLDWSPVPADNASIWLVAWKHEGEACIAAALELLQQHNDVLDDLRFVESLSTPARRHDLPATVWRPLAGEVHTWPCEIDG